LLAGAIVWIVLAEPALFVVWGISFPFAAALCFLLRGTADILSRERRKYGILSACGRLISVVLALGLSFLYIYLVKETSYLYLLASPTAIAFGYLAGMIGAWKEEKS
ncbi:MAG TPA: hypothetical protein DEA32_01020, partial [Firmicutes bacterium]|nr:hypothetical protein [Bacillota bacterium]